MPKAKIIRVPKINVVLHGNSLEVLRRYPAAFFDSIVCDPPYELGFMGKQWDSTGIAFSPALWREVLRVLKPGGHLLAFSGSRTYHRMACAIEDAGFKIRDQIQWIYGSGFPKSQNISKAIDKQAGASREVIGQAIGTGKHNKRCFVGGTRQPVFDVTKAATEDAQQWEGWGTALKPAHEPIVMARKPFTGTVANNVLTNGTGGLNIDGCRIPTQDKFHAIKLVPKNRKQFVGNNISLYSGTGTTERYQQAQAQIIARTMELGRWPANVILDEEAGQLLDDQTGMQVSRFFYCGKASSKERNEGLDHLHALTAPQKYGLKQGNLPQQTPHYNLPKVNNHPTVKPIALMQYLIRLVTPAGGIVLDPFAGSGSTGVAAVAEGMRYVVIDSDESSVTLSRARINHREYTVRPPEPVKRVKVKARVLRVGSA